MRQDRWEALRRTSTSHYNMLKEIRGNKEIGYSSSRVIFWATTPLKRLWGKKFYYQQHCKQRNTVYVLIFVRWLELTRHSACPGSEDWEPAWPAHSPVSLWQCACTGPSGWREVWWHTSGRHPQSSCTESVEGSGSQMLSGPTRQQTHIIFLLNCITCL